MQHDFYGQKLTRKLGAVEDFRRKEARADAESPSSPPRLRCNVLSNRGHVTTTNGHKVVLDDLLADLERGKTARRSQEL